MEHQKIILLTHKKLKINFNLWFYILVLLFIYCFTTDYPFPKLNATLAINFQQLLILCLFGGIPGVLIWSKKKMKTLTEISDIQKRLMMYKKYVHIRQSVFFTLGFFVLFMQLFTGMKGAMMLFFILICFCMFIIPTKNRIKTEAFPDKPESDESDTDTQTSQSTNVD